jgi:hypothetical protein
MSKTDNKYKQRSYEDGEGGNAKPRGPQRNKSQARRLDRAMRTKNLDEILDLYDEDE